jgi:hypothetical protein
VASQRNGVVLPLVVRSGVARVPVAAAALRRLKAAIFPHRVGATRLAVEARKDASTRPGARWLGSPGSSGSILRPDSAQGEPPSDPW